MTLGGNDKKKVALLGILIGGWVIYMVYTNLLEGPPPGTAPQQVSRGTTPLEGPTIGTPGPPTVKRVAPTRRSGEDFHPVLRSKRPEDRIDPRTVDPTLRLDLLAKVQGLEQGGASRNLFAIAPPPKPPEQLKGPEPKVRVAMGPPVYTPPPPPPPKPPEPPPQPPPYKFYGISTVRENGKKTAYFLDGEDILIAAEGEVLKRRYKLLRIGKNSVLMEDLEGKRQVSLPLIEETPG